MRFQRLVFALAFFSFVACLDVKSVGHDDDAGLDGGATDAGADGGLVDAGLTDGGLCTFVGTRLDAELTARMSLTSAGAAAIRHNPDGSLTGLIGAPTGQGGTGQLNFVFQPGTDAGTAFGRYVVTPSLACDAHGWSVSMYGAPNNVITGDGVGIQIDAAADANPTRLQLTVTREGSAEVLAREVVDVEKSPIRFENWCGVWPGNPPNSTVWVTRSNLDAGVLMPDTTYELVYTVIIVTDRPANWVVLPSLFNASAGWSATAHQTLTTLGTHAEETFQVPVALHTGPNGTADFSLGVVLDEPYLGNIGTGTSSLESLTVGASVAPASAAFSVEVIGSVQTLKPGTLVMISSTDATQQRAFVWLRTNRLAETGVYTINAPTVSNADWSVVSMNNPMTLGPAGGDVRLVVQANSGAQDAEATVSVTSPTGQVESFRIQLKLRSSACYP